MREVKVCYSFFFMLICVENALICTENVDLNGKHLSAPYNNSEASLTFGHANANLNDYHYSFL